MPIAQTPLPPYYAVIFTTMRSDKDAKAYAQMAERMVKLAREQPGFLGVEMDFFDVGKEDLQV